MVMNPIKFKKECQGKKLGKSWVVVWSHSRVVSWVFSQKLFF